MMKPIQIRRDDVVQDIRELSSLTGRPITDAVASAVRAELAQVKRRCSIEERRRRIDETIKRFREAVGDRELPDDGFFYDEDGFPK